jgi:hypothetical protein
MPSGRVVGRPWLRFTVFFVLFVLSSVAVVVVGGGVVRSGDLRV